jgi:hypothetical protein
VNRENDALQQEVSRLRGAVSGYTDRIAALEEQIRGTGHRENRLQVRCAR